MTTLSDFIWWARDKARENPEVADYELVVDDNDPDHHLRQGFEPGELFIDYPNKQVVIVVVRENDDELPVYDDFDDDYEPARGDD